MDDNEILDLYFARSDQAIVETKTKYGRLCMSVARKILWNYQDNEECVNDTYLHAWNSIPPNRPNAFSAYLARITRNLALDRYEYNRAKKRNAEMETVFLELESCLSTDAGFEEKELTMLMNTFLQNLNVESRIIFVLHYWYGASIDEISKKLGTGGGKIKSSLFLTRKKLKSFLAEGGIKA